MRVGGVINGRIAAAAMLGGWLSLAGVDAVAQTEIGLARSVPEAVGLSSPRLALIDEAVAASIQANETPGAVVLVARHGSIGYLKAFGSREVQPGTEAMTTDTIFDMASLTKVLATTPSIMILVENGSIRLGDKVKRYLPKFTGGGKDNITVHQLLTHYSGLPPDFDLSKHWMGYEAALEELWKMETQSEPGKEFAYSDLNFIALGEIVHAVSGKTLDVFANERVFQPLGMSETTFNPPEEWHLRIAPTESRRHTLEYLKGKWTADISDEILRGEVHDPTAWQMGGVAGHAGLFSSARDVAIYARMLMNRGRYHSRRILSPAGVQAMTRPESPRDSSQVRGFGWDIDSSYSSPRGDLFSEGYGHTGFTGTSLWLLPHADTFIVLLTNRVHPDGKGDVTHLRGVIANIVATAISDTRRN
ncbi:MAG TPA: serine hydrolase domain-containing protein [Acidobacteriota bacterium]|nr:serine hydrolase domain-containing protein [Acidobacteriota bacterium]